MTLKTLYNIGDIVDVDGEKKENCFYSSVRIKRKPYRKILFRRWGVVHFG